MCIYPDGYWRDFVMLTYTFPCMYSIISYWIKGLTCIFLKTQYPSSLEPRTFSKWEFGVSRSGVKYMRCISGSSWILATKVLYLYLLIASSIWTPNAYVYLGIGMKFSMIIFSMVKCMNMEYWLNIGITKKTSCRICLLSVLRICTEIILWSLNK